MFDIYLGKRISKNGRDFDYTFLKYSDGELNYEIRKLSSDSKYFSLDPGVILAGSDILTPDNVSFEQMRFFNKVANEIKVVANELRPNYKPANFVEDDQSVRQNIVLTLSEFKAWKYITASECLNNFVSKCNQINDKVSQNR